MCVEARVAWLCAHADSKEWRSRAHHERQRIAVWIAFLGRWQLPIDRFIMKAIEDALFSPMRGYVKLPINDVPYMTTRQTVQSHLFGMTLGDRQDYLSQLESEAHETLGVLRRSQWQLKALCNLVECLELKLGLLIDSNDDDGETITARRRS